MKSNSEYKTSYKLDLVTDTPVNNHHLKLIKKAILAASEDFFDADISLIRATITATAVSDDVSHIDFVSKSDDIIRLGDRVCDSLDVSRCGIIMAIDRDFKHISGIKDKEAWLAVQYPKITEEQISGKWVTVKNSYDSEIVLPIDRINKLE